MQLPGDDAALVFASAFYGQIARGEPLDRAMTWARESVKMTNRSLEWATPVLFLSSEETQVSRSPARTVLGRSVAAGGDRKDQHGPNPRWLGPAVLVVLAIWTVIRNLPPLRGVLDAP